MNDIDLDELERLANDATGGPWTAQNLHIEGCSSKWEERVAAVSRLPRREENAAYIAAMNPITTKALIARIRELEAQVAYPPVGTCAECSHWGASWEKKEDDPKRCAMMKTGICMDGELERDDTLAKGYGNYDADSGWVETKSSFSCCMFERKEK